MKTRTAYLRAGAIALLVAGCTTFTATQVNPHDPRARGILIPEQVPLLVIANGQVSTVMVRSPDRATAIQFGAFLAKHDVQIDFNDNGSLKSLKSNQDSTAVPLKLIDVVGSLAEHVIPAGHGLSGNDSQSTSLQIYRIRFENGEVAELIPLLINGRNFPPPELHYQPMSIAGESVASHNKAEAPPKGN